MTMDIRRAQLWQAMGLGPIYRLRTATTHTPAEAELALPVADRAASIARLEWKELEQEVARYSQWLESLALPSTQGSRHA